MNNFLKNNLSYSPKAHLFSQPQKGSISKIMRSCSLLLLLPLAFAFSVPAQPGDTCAPPTNVGYTIPDAGTAYIYWDAVSGASGYKIKYVRQEDNYHSPEYSTVNNSYIFSGLPSGRYTICLQTDCGSETSECISISDFIME